MIGTPDGSAGFDPVQTIDDYADYYGVPAELAQSVMQRESGGNHYDRDGSVLASGRGYRGLMGMHPVTAAGLGLGFNADDPEENVHAGLKYLGQNLEEFDGNRALALAGYHSGPHRAVAALSDPGDIRTKSYVKSILGPDYGGYWHEGTDEDPSGPGTSSDAMLSQTKAAQSGESDQPQGGTANLKLPLNSFQQMLHQMLASKPEATSSPNQDNLNLSQVKLPWTQAPGSAYVSASPTDGNVDSANKQQVQPVGNATDQSQIQTNESPVNKGSVGSVTINPESPDRIVEQGQQPITEPDLYRNWYHLRERDPEAAQNLAQYYLQTFPDSPDPQQVRRAQAVRNYLNTAARQPRVNINLYGYSAEQPPTDGEISDRIAAQLGFTQEEAAAYRSEMGRDPFYWSTGLQPNKALAARAGDHPLGAVSIPETRTGAIAETQAWLRNHREQARLQELAALPDLQAKYLAARRIAAVRPLTEQEKRILEVDKMPGGMLGGLLATFAGGMVRGEGSLMAGLGQLFGGLSDDESRRFAELTNKVVNWTPLTDGEEAEYRQLIQKTNWLQRHGVEAQKSAQAGLNVFEPHTLPGALAEAGGEMLPEIGLSLGLPEVRLAHAAYWAGVSYLKARGSGASKAQAIGDAATAVAMLGASAPLSPLAGEAGEGWRTALAKGVTRGGLGVGMGSALGAMQPGATPQSALSQGVQFGLMNLAGGDGTREEDLPRIGPQAFDPLVRAWAEGRLAGAENAHLREELGRRFGLDDPVPEQPPFDAGLSGTSGRQQIDPASSIGEESPTSANISSGQRAEEDENRRPTDPSLPAAAVPENKFVGRLYNRDLDFPGVVTEFIDVVMQSPDTTEAMRAEFDRSKRGEILADLATDPDTLKDLVEAGLDAEDISRMRAKTCPRGYQAHHKLPLQFGGENLKANVILVKFHPYHKALTNYQREVAQRLKEGEMTRIRWPRLDGIVYPPKKGE
jgi:hypothetical protein